MMYDHDVSWWSDSSLCLVRISAEDDHWQEMVANPGRVITRSSSPSLSLSLSLSSSPSSPPGGKRQKRQESTDHNRLPSYHPPFSEESYLPTIHHFQKKATYLPSTIFRKKLPTYPPLGWKSQLCSLFGCTINCEQCGVLWRVLPGLPKSTIDEVKMPEELEVRGPETSSLFIWQNFNANLVLSQDFLLCWKFV